MDLNQVIQLLTWLDEEHRKDKALLMTMQSQIDAQKAQLTEQARQLQDIQASLSRIEGQLPRLGQLDAAIQGVRSEFSGLLAKHSAEQDARDDMRTRSSKLEAESMARIVRQIQERVEGIGSFDQVAALLREEDGKLRGEVARAFNQFLEVNKRLDAQDERLALLSQEAQGSRDGLAANRLEHEALNAQHLSLKAVVDALGPRLETRLDQLQSGLEAESKAQQAGVNSLQLRLQEWDRRQEELSAEFRSSQPPLARWNKQLEEFAAQFDRNRKTLYDMQELEQQVRQQGSEMAELQRLAVERQRTELREWQDNQVRVDDEQTARLVRLETWQTKFANLSQSLEDRLEQNKQAIQACSDELWQVWTRFIQAQGKVLDGLKQEKPR